MKVKGLTCILVFLLGSVGMLRAAEPSVTFFLIKKIAFCSKKAIIREVHFLNYTHSYEKKYSLL